MKLLKIASALLAILLFTSCDTGYSGDIDPQKEIFNYKYPLKTGYVWEYRVTEKNTKFSNSAVAVLIGTDSIVYRMQKDTCISSTSSDGDISYGIQTFKTAEANSISGINTATYVSSGLTSYSNSDIGLWQESQLNSPAMILKYNIYAGESWRPIETNPQKLRKIDSFTDLNGQRACLIKVIEYTLSDTVTFDEYYSKRGLEKFFRQTKFSATNESGQEIGTYENYITIELIRTNAK